VLSVCQPSDFDNSVLDDILQLAEAMHLDYLPTMQEIDKAVRQLASGKAPAADCIPAEIFKKVGMKLKKHLL